MCYRRGRFVSSSIAYFQARTSSSSSSSSSGAETETDNNRQGCLGPNALTDYLRIARWDDDYMEANTEFFTEEGDFASPPTNSSDSENPQQSFNHTNFSILFLGTSAGVPNLKRSCSATLLIMGGLTYLFDAGEGLQRQLMYSHAEKSDIRRIFITHMHGDHIFGLPSLLLQLQLVSNGSKGVAKELDVYGPPGIYNFIAAIVSLSQAHLSQRCRIVVHELVGGSVDPGPTVDPIKQTRVLRKSFNHSHYPELSNRSLERRLIHRDSRGVWNLQIPRNAPTREAIVDAGGKRLNFSNNVSSGADKEVFVTAAEVMHTRGIQTFGYVVREQDPPMKLDPQKAMDLGVAPGTKYSLLTNGFSVQSDDGSREVTPEQVKGDQVNRARKFVLIGDTCRLSQPMYEISRNADVFVHEATLGEEQMELVWNRGHSTAGMAGLAARDVEAKVLVMNHISNREPPIPVVKEARATNGHVSHIVAAQDFLEVRVPYAGFQSRKAMLAEKGDSNDRD